MIMANNFRLLDAELLQDLQASLHRSISGEVNFDWISRVLYSTDASIYQIVPLGVVFPRDEDELAACVSIAAGHGVPILARGAGSSLAGQAIGHALIIDCARYLRRPPTINVEEGSASVQPGVILNTLNRAAAIHQLQFGPDPASGERATVGGSLANNATGAHSILYGMAADHLLAAEVILADGSQCRFESISIQEAERRAGQSGSREAAIYRNALAAREIYRDAIHERWPKTWRRASGYNLNYLIPWSGSAPPHWAEASRSWPGSAGHGKSLPYPPVSPGTINLAPLIAGSEGTLGVIRRATVRLVPLPSHTVLVVLGYPDLSRACRAVPGLLESEPSAIELIPGSLVRLAQSVPAYARQLAFLDGLLERDNPAATLLVLEYAGDELAGVRAKACAVPTSGEISRLVAEEPHLQRQIWAGRKVGLGILMSSAGDTKPVSFIEDLAVPVEHLANFADQMQDLMRRYGVGLEVYAHASVGCLHFRPLLNLKSAEDVGKMRAIAQEAVKIVAGLGGAVSGEHGDGLARSEWIESTLGRDIMQAFRQIKQAADPAGILNPGKILDAGRMDENLRYGPAYQTAQWRPFINFVEQGGFTGAIEQCNGAGVCRKSEGVMCPSFQATQDEMHSTRGRANLLRAMLSGQLDRLGGAKEQAVWQALDLCLACKGCKAECPSGVDMAKLKYEFMHHYYDELGHRHAWRDYLFAHITTLGMIGQPVSPLANLVLTAISGKNGERILGLAPARNLPRLAKSSLRRQAEKLAGRPGRATNRHGSMDSVAGERVLFLSDGFAEYFHPEIGLAAIQALSAAGCQVEILPVVGSGRTSLSKGFVRQARQQAQRVARAIEQADPECSLAIVGVEPSEIYTLRDEYRDLLPEDPGVASLRVRAWMIDEYLIRPDREGRERILRIVERVEPAQSSPKKVLLHGHCYQKAQPPAEDGYPVGVEATRMFLERLGYPVQVIEAGCCGMAGAFGYEAEHYELSMKIGRQALFPVIREDQEQSIVAAAGASCQAQILDGTGREAVHPISLLQFGPSQSGTLSTHNGRY